MLNFATLAILFVGVLVSITSYVASADEYDKFRAEYEQFNVSNQRQFQQFKDANDAAYVKWLGEQWQSYERFAGLVRDTVPKPAKAPSVANEKAITRSPDQIPNTTAKPAAALPSGGNLNIVKSGIEGSQIARAGPISSGSQIKQKKTGHPSAVVSPAAANVEFFSQSLYLPVLAVTLGTIHSERDIALGWTALAQSNYQPVLSNIKQRRDELHLSDWGVLQLIQHQAKGLFINRNHQQLYRWFILNKLGYRVSAGMDKHRLVLLFASEQTVYGQSFFQLQGQRFYVLDKERSGALQLPSKPYPAALRAVNLRFGNSLTTSTNIESRTLTVKGRTYSIDSLASRNDYFDSYPQLDLKHYFDAPVSAVTDASLREQLLPELKGKTQMQQVNWLLNWVQLGFVYKLDHEQFGGENYLHPEESFRFPGNDCEDRSFLFSWLVRELVGLSVIGISYPGHVATAVAFDPKMAPRQGKSFYHKGRAYWVADPTYIGAKAGRIMPQYRKVAPTVL